MMGFCRRETRDTRRRERPGSEDQSPPVPVVREDNGMPTDRLAPLHAGRLAPVLRSGDASVRPGGSAGSPAGRGDAEFVDRVNQARHVVGDELAKHFVLLRGVRLAQHYLPEQPLHGAEGRFDVAPLVVVRQVVLALGAEEMPHPFVVATHAAGRVAPERRLERATDALHGFKIVFAV
jgi:hypothetical protein